MLCESLIYWFILAFQNPHISNSTESWLYGFSICDKYMALVQTMGLVQTKRQDSWLVSAKSLDLSCAMSALSWWNRVLSHWSSSCCPSSFAVSWLQSSDSKPIGVWKVSQGNLLLFRLPECTGDGQTFYNPVEVVLSHICFFWWHEFSVCLSLLWGF